MWFANYIISVLILILPNSVLNIPLLCDDLLLQVVTMDGQVLEDRAPPFLGVSDPNQSEEESSSNS